MTAVGLPQSHNETYTGWYNKAGKISTSGLFQYVFYIIFNSCVTHPLCIYRAHRTSELLSRSENDNHPKKLPASFCLSQKSSIDTQEIVPVLAPAPPTTAVPTAMYINKRVSPKQKRTSQKRFFRGKKEKMQGNPTHVKSAATKGVRSKAKKASKPNSLPGGKLVSEKYMRLTIKDLLVQNFLNVNTKEWEKVTIEVASTLKTECRTVMHVIKDIVNDQDGKSQEGMKELETSWEGLTLSI